MPKPEAVSEAPAIKATVQDEAVETQTTDVDIDAVAEAVEAAEAETSEAAEESSTSEEKKDAKAELAGEEQEEESDGLEEFTQPEAKKDNVQKRIDQLTAQLRKLEAENEKLKGSDDTSKKKSPKYTDEQLKGALQKALDEGDSALAWEIIQYRTDRVKDDLIEMYENEKKSAVNASQAVQQDWQRVCNDYSKVWADDNGKEIYPGAKSELSLGSESSLLYRLALKMYYDSKDDNGRPVYHYQGGQRQAVADAVNQILRKRKLSPNDSEKEKLKRSLAKAKRKSSIPSSSSADGETKKIKSSGDSLSDYLAERKKYRNERM